MERPIVTGILRALFGLIVSSAAMWVATGVREGEAASVRPDSRHVRKVDFILSSGDAYEVGVVGVGFILAPAISLPHLYQVARSAARTVKETGNVNPVELANINTIVTASMANSDTYSIVYTYFLPDLPQHNPQLLAWILSVAAEETDDDAFYERCLRELSTKGLPADHENVIWRMFQTCWNSRRGLLGK